MKLRTFSRSLTLRLALLYALSTLCIVAAMAIYLLRVIDQHFVEQDLAEMHGKLELASRLIAKAHSENNMTFLQHQLDDALVGHHHLALALFENGNPSYAYGNSRYPPALLAAATPSLSAARMLSWDNTGTTHRGLALRLATPPGSVDRVLVVAVDTGHHREFLDHFTLALWVVFGLSAVIASVLAWAAARIGLAPLRQTAKLASEITANRIDTRLATDQVPPELEDLASSFNAMLDRLRDSIERLSAFAADLAHEMRTPVSNLMMQTQVMLTQERSNDDYREVLASNLEEYERLARTIGDMLFLAKADNGLIVPTRETVHLETELTGLIDFYEAFAEDKGVRLRLEGKASVDGDRLMLRRAMSNLLSNAIRYTVDGSEVTIRVSQSADRADICIANPCAELPQSLERLFDRFHRADPTRRNAGNGDGAGLGLAITRSIAHAHGGEVTASGTAAGIEFRLSLPADCRPA